jgi:putative phage-type endonuclease
MMAQRSPQWRAARLGKVTASRVADVIARTRSGYSASRANYAAQLVAERLTGVHAETFVSPAMQWGIEQEADARTRYDFETDVAVSLVGFADHPRLAMCGASPDGLVGEEGLLEIKCPLTATHLETLLGAAPPSKYLAQMQWQMAVTGRAWCDFASYDPRLPFDLQFFICHIPRDEAVIAALEAEVSAFLDDVAETVDRLRNGGLRRLGIGPAEVAA